MAYINLYISDMDNPSCYGWYSVESYSDESDIYDMFEIPYDHTILYNKCDTDLNINAKDDHPNIKKLARLIELCETEDDEVVNAILDNRGLSETIDILERDNYRIILLRDEKGLTVHHDEAYEIVGRAIVDDNADVWETPAWIMKYFDYAKYGWQYIKDSGGIITEHYFIDLF